MINHQQIKESIKTIAETNQLFWCQCDTPNPYYLKRKLSIDKQTVEKRCKDCKKLMPLNKVSDEI